MSVNPVLLGITVAACVGIGCLYLAERRDARRSRPPYPSADDWNWDDWQDAE